MDNSKNPKMGEIPKIYICKCCTYSTESKKDFEKHKITLKHKRNVKITEQIFHCECGKSYRHKSGLCKHRKKCLYKEDEDDELQENKLELKSADTENLLKLIKEDPEFKKVVIEITKETKESENIVINSTQTHHKTENNHVSINVFLNEQCKDAINFEDFINQIQVTRDDIVNNAEVGFIDGMCDIVTNNLDKMPLQIRPIHCTDIKRKTVYMRNNDTWTKDNNVIDDNMNKALRKLSSGSIFTLNNWKNENTDYNDGSSDFSNKCVYIMKSSMVISGGDDPGKKVLNKIACNVKYDGNK